VAREELENSARRTKSDEISLLWHVEENGADTGCVEGGRRCEGEGGRARGKKW